MATESQPNHGKPQQVNLQQIAKQFMFGLQQHFDMLAFNLASREAVQEAAYNTHSNAPRIMPVAPRHQNFEQMQAYARDLLVRQVVGDSMNLAVTALNNAHFFLALVKNSQANSNVNAQAQQAAQNEQQAFLRAPLDEKFNSLEQNYGIMCELEDTLTSLGLALQSLMQNGGRVLPAHLDESGELVLELKAVEILDEQPGPNGLKGKLVDQRKVFRADEMIQLSDVDLQLVLVTLASFADALFKSVAQYAQKMSEPSE
ncbi:MAG: hypothetical protein ACI81V_000942 [Lentimonas sp.]|jgi:hypothetical protein